MLLGLPAALVAHALVFGGEHAVGGALQSAALAAGALVLLLALALHSRDAVQGSVLASRLRSQMPSLIALLLCAGAWFAALELCESPHAIPLLAVAGAVAAACILLRAGITLFSRVIANAAIAIIHALECTYAQELCLACAIRIAPRPVRTLAHAIRLFSRPPPVLS